MRILTILLAAALAGCAQPGAGGDEDALPTDTGVPTVIPIEVPVGGVAGVADGSAAGEVVVPAGASLLSLEALWACTSPTCEAQVVLLHASGRELGRGQGTGSASFEILDPPSGTHGVQWIPTGPVADASGTVTVTVYGGPSPS